VDPAGSDSAGRPVQILVVDDNPEIRTMVATRLSRCGFAVIEAADGEQALTIARDQPPALVVLDVMMPGISGWEVARELKQDPTTSKIVIVMLTAIGSAMNEMTSPLYGADAHLDKPFDLQELEATIVGLLARR
jgi:DNA-binding response OmpR family regulator